MLIDHIGLFIVDTPIWLRWIGRISAPLFMFCVIWGFSYTSNKKKYLIRLYIFSVGMALLNLFMNVFLIDENDYIANNFITTLLLTGLIIYLINKNEVKLYVVFAVWQLVTSVLCIAFDQIGFLEFSSSYPSYMFFGALLGNVFFTEGGVLFVVLGVLLYLTRNNRFLLITFYAGFSLVIYLLIKRYGYHSGFTEYLLPFADFQWMMIGALPFMLLYNHKKGIGLKYFFYIFYPLHIVLLFLIGRILS